MKFDLKRKWIGPLDIEKISKIFYPYKNSKCNRVAFMFIYMSLSMCPEGKTTTAMLEGTRKEHAPEISKKVMMQTLKEMDSIGLIYQRKDLFWRFSGRFSESLTRFADSISEMLAIYYTTAQERDYEWLKFHITKAQILMNDKESESYIDRQKQAYFKRAKLLLRIDKESKKILNEYKLRKKELVQKAKLSSAAWDLKNTI